MAVGQQVFERPDLSAPYSGYTRPRPELGFHRGFSSIVVNLSTGAIVNGNKIEQAVPLASVTKLMTAATAFYHNGKFTKSQMSQFLSRSNNAMGPLIAKQTAGSEAAFVKLMNEHAARIGMRNFNFTNTTGLNPDGTGPTASPADIARLLNWFHKQPGGAEFLSKHASPNSGLGHTMSYAFDEGGVIAAKTGTNPQAGDFTGAVLFKGPAGQPYAAFVHTNDGDQRRSIIPRIINETRHNRQTVIGQLDMSGPKPVGPQIRTAQTEADRPAPTNKLQQWYVAKPAQG